MEIKKAKLSDALNSIKTNLKKAIANKVTGVAYMYVAGDKILSVSVENLEDDTNLQEEKKVDIKKEDTDTTNAKTEKEGK